jgi:hypothetical protein
MGVNHLYYKSESERLDLSHVSQDRANWPSLVSTVIFGWFAVIGRKFLNQLSSYYFLVITQVSRITVKYTKSK